MTTTTKYGANFPTREQAERAAAGVPGAVVREVQDGYAVRVVALEQDKRTYDCARLERLEAFVGEFGTESIESITRTPNGGYLVRVVTP